MHDLEAGRRICLNDATEMRLFGGFRWAQVDQDEAAQYAYTNFLGDTSIGDITSRSELEAYGIRIGAEGWWNMPWGLSLFGRAAGSVLVGRVRVEQQEFDEIEQLILDFVDSYDQSMPVIETAAGVAWTHGIWQVAGGYEMSSWFNIAEVDRASYDLVLDGFFVRLSVAH